MDDDFKESRPNKPQQKFYKPGSGPLRKSSYGSDSKMNSYDIVSRNRSRDRSHYGSKSSIYEEDTISKEHSMTNNRKKPDQQHYIARSGDCKSDSDKQSTGRCDNSSHSYNRRRNDKHGYNSGSYQRGQREGSNDVNYNRNYRQISEPRSSSPGHYARGRDNSAADRNRDSKSMETSANRHMSGGGKPPSGRRNSAGYASDSPRPKYMLNLDNLPPRLRKKYLEQSGHHSFDSTDHSNKYQNTTSVQNSYNQGSVYNSTPTWSQTLPSRGRGRLRDNENFDREKYIHTYLKTSNNLQNSRRSTPSSSYTNLYDSTVYENADSNHSMENNKYDDGSLKNGVISNDHKKQIQEDPVKQESDSEAVSYNSTNYGDMTSLDWTEEVEREARLDDESTTSSPSFQLKSTSVVQEVKPVETRASEPRESKKRPRRDKRNASRRAAKGERGRGDSSGQGEAPPPPPPPARERRDSHRSTRSSNIGNSRDDLDRWRSLRSFSREHSTEGRIVSQCNSRDVSANRDHDGFRVPLSVAKNGNHQRKNNGGAWSGRTPSTERGRQSPSGDPVPEAPSGGGSRQRRRRNKGRSKNSENTAPPQLQPQAHVAHVAHTAHSAHNAHGAQATNWRDEILESKKQSSLQDRLDRHREVNRNRLNSCQSDKSESSTPHPGLLILPQGSIAQVQKDKIRETSVDTQKTLFDPHNPSKPIVVQTQHGKIDSRLERAASESWARQCCALGPEPGDVEASEASEAGDAGEASEAGEAQRAARHRPLLQQVDRADAILQTHMLRGPITLAAHWPDVTENRKFLQNALQKLLLSDLKYCQADNVEHHFWKILYYTFIEKLRKSLAQVTPEEKTRIVKLINTIIEEGNSYFENLVNLLEKTYRFNTDDYINGHHVLPPKGLGYVGLALISVQKLYVFLGDLARYKEQVNETNNYAKSKFWYTKAQQINPKNGRPYNQLAILAIYARRKLDAVYYYMRSLMSSNPFHSARESLISLFDENRKKYEAAERKRKAALESANSTDTSDNRTVKENGQRREIWVRPGTARNTGTPQIPDDGLANMTPVELNKNFITSYLHVHGKLVTKIGMESLQECAAVMLRQFRALLRQQPMPIPGQRLLQLTALNMFAVESTAAQHKDGEVRSPWLESALAVSLLMFGALLERCCALLPEPEQSQQHADALLLLPAIKVWSDWMLCHSSLWNPPPSFDSYDTGSEMNPWVWLAKLMNILETRDDKSIVFESEMKDGYEPVHLSEDLALSGFTPLMYMEPAAAYVTRSAAAALPPHLAEHSLRARKLLFFGTEYLVGVEPPVLSVVYGEDAAPRYVSVVQNTSDRPSLHNLVEESAEELCLIERDTVNPRGSTPVLEMGVSDPTDEATRRLLKKKEQLEQRRADMERRRQRLQEVLSGGGGGGGVRVETEVSPRWLVPDTNCFIEHLAALRRLAARVSLAVPLVVVTELEGLRNCTRIGEQASEALAWLSQESGVRFATSRGSLLNSRVFTAEQQEPSLATNDDRVLATALNLHDNISNEPDVEASSGGGGGVRCVRRVCEVVLLTDDRGLRVKALAADLPVRDLNSFVQWMFDESDNRQAGLEGAQPAVAAATTTAAATAAATTGH